MCGWGGEAGRSAALPGSYCPIASVGMPCRNLGDCRSEPSNGVALDEPNGANVASDAYRPEAGMARPAVEMQAGMGRILLEQPIGCPSAPANICR